MLTISGQMEGGQLCCHLSLDQVEEVVTHPRGLVWINAIAPSVEELAAIERVAGFDPFLFGEARQRHPRPTIHRMNEQVFLVVFGLRLEQRSLDATELRILASPRVLVTIQETELPQVSLVLAEWRNRPAPRRTHRVGRLVYTLLEAIIAGYYPVVDEIADDIEALDELIFARSDAATQSAIFDLKKLLIALRRILGSKRDALDILLRRDDPVFEAELIPSFARLHA